MVFAAAGHSPCNADPSRLAGADPVQSWTGLWIFFARHANLDGRTAIHVLVYHRGQQTLPID